MRLKTRINNNSISERDQLVLLLIAKSGMVSVYKLGMIFDRCDFPGKVGKNFSVLEKNKLISVLQANEFNHPIKYATTKNGLAFLEQNLNPKLLIAHINKMSNPDFMLKLVKAILQIN